MQSITQTVDAFKKCKYDKEQEVREQKDKIRNAAKVFLKMKMEGVSKRDALIFVQKLKCKTDLTQKWDGTKRYRKLKLKANPTFQHHGWEIAGNYTYDVEPYYQTTERFQDIDEVDTQIDKNLEHCHKNSASSYQAKIDAIKLYINDIDKLYGIHKIREQKCKSSGRKLIQLKSVNEPKVSQIYNDMCHKHSSPKMVLRIKDIDIQCLIEEFYGLKNIKEVHQLKDVIDDNLISKLQAFSTIQDYIDTDQIIETLYNEKIQSKDDDQIKINNNSSSILINSTKPDKSQENKQTQGYLSLGDQTISISDKEETQNNKKDDQKSSKQVIEEPKRFQRKKTCSSNFQKLDSFASDQIERLTNVSKYVDSNQIEDKNLKNLCLNVHDYLSSFYKKNIMMPVKLSIQQKTEQRQKLKNLYTRKLSEGNLRPQTQQQYDIKIDDPYQIQPKTPQIKPLLLKKYSQQGNRIFQQTTHQTSRISTQSQSRNITATSFYNRQPYKTG